MNRGLKLTVGICAAILPVVVAYKIAYPTYDWRQKLTVEVWDGGKIYDASSVSEVSITFQPSFLVEIPPLRSNLRGEAVVLEIPDRGTLFVLLSGLDGQNLQSLASVVFHDQLPTESSKGLFAALSELRERRTLQAMLYPLMVTFADTNNPTTIKLVNPDDLEASFGPGVRLGKITLEITDQKVSEGRIERELSWLNWPRGRFLAAGKGENPLRAPSNGPKGYTTFGRTEFIRRAK